MKIRRINWYADEWLSGTAVLKADERGVYITICCLIYSRGGPIPDDERDLARLCGCHWREFRRIRDNLIARGKIVPEDGRIMVKRCAKELQESFKKAAEASQNGRKGGLKSKENNVLAQADASWSAVHKEKKEKSSPLPLLPSPLDSPSIFPLTPFLEKKEKKISTRVFDPRFVRFWESYPKKVGKGAAERSFLKALTLGATVDELLAGVDRYLEHNPKDCPWCNPATWLNQERWNDEYGNGIDKHAEYEARVAVELEEYRRKRRAGEVEFSTLGDNGAS